MLQIVKFSRLMLTNARDFLPVVAVIAFFQSVVGKPPAQFEDILIGLAFTLIGLTLFVRGLNMSLFASGQDLTGRHRASRQPPVVSLRPCCCCWIERVMEHNRVQFQVDPGATPGRSGRARIEGRPRGRSNRPDGPPERARRGHGPENDLPRLHMTAAHDIVQVEESLCSNILTVSRAGKFDTEPVAEARRRGCGWA